MKAPRRGQGERKENTMLKLEHLAWAVPGGEDIIKEIDLELGDGKLIVVTGPNGGGKTTLAKLIAGEMCIRDSTRASTFALRAGVFWIAPRLMPKLWQPESKGMAQRGSVESEDLCTGLSFRCV